MRLAREKKYAKFCGEWVWGLARVMARVYGLHSVTYLKPRFRLHSAGASFRWGATIRAWQKCKSPEVLFGLLGH
jgi:hypothetical protein